jgi:hypothetical protein
VYTFYTLANDGARVVLDGDTLIDAWTSSTDYVNATVALVAGQFYGFEMQYRELAHKADVKLEWSTPSDATRTVVPASAFYHSRHLTGSPMTVVIYPGPIDAITTNTTGSGLTTGEALTETSFTIQARDTEANYRYNDGTDSFIFKLQGIGDWAGQGRTDEVVTGTPIDIPVVHTPVNWTQICAACGKATHNSYVLATTADLRCPNGPSSSCIERGQELIVGGETFRVHSTNPFTNVAVPLDRVYVGPTTGATTPVYRAGTTTGQHLVKYTPKVRGTYTLEIRVPPTVEVQYVSTEATATLGGKFSLSYGGEQTTDIAFDASAADVEAALEDLSTLRDYGVNVTLHTGPGSNLEQTWHITFPYTQSGGVYRDHDAILPILTNGYLLTGNAAKMKAGVVTQGVAEKHIVGSPFTVLVAPEMTDPTRTIAYGEGLVHGEAGVETGFTIQAKDSWGNNRWENQTKDIFSVRVYQPSVSPLVASQLPHFAEQKWDEATGRRFYVNSKTGEIQWEKPMVATIFGKVTYLQDGTYEVKYTPEVKGTYTVAVTMAQIHEVQTVQTSFGSTAGRGGTWFLSQTYNGVLSKTPDLAWDASADSVKTALLTLPSVTAVDVSRIHKHEASPFVYAITFSQFVGDMPPLVSDYASLTGTTPTVQVVETAKGVSAHIDTHRRPVRNEVQRVRLSATGAPPGGNFQLQFRGHTTSILAVTATATQVKNALEALEVIGQVSVVASASGNDIDFDVEFVPQGPLVSMTTIAMTQITTDSLSLATVTHSATSSVGLTAGDTVEITSFVSNAWANGIWTVVGSPTTTSFNFLLSKVAESVQVHQRPTRKQVRLTRIFKDTTLSLPRSCLATCPP